MIPEIQTIQIC